MRIFSILLALLFVPITGFGEDKGLLQTSVQLVTHYSSNRDGGSKRNIQSTDILSTPTLTSASGEIASIQIAQNFEIDDQDDIPVGLGVWIRSTLEEEIVSFSGRFELTELFVPEPGFEPENPVFQKLIVPFKGKAVLGEEANFEAGSSGSVGFSKENESGDWSRVLSVTVTKVEPRDSGNGENALEEERTP